MSAIHSAVDALQSALIGFAQELVRIRSYSGEEEAVIRHIETHMRRLGYDETTLDAMGNLVGRIGTGSRTILLDAHIDTVTVNDADQWRHDPFGGVIADGSLHGRGAVDMKSAAAAAIYAGAVAGQLGLAGDATILVSLTVMEEDCDGENLKHLFAERSLRPDWVVICEPSDNHIALGHKGKAQVAIRTRGVSAHGSTPEAGKNAIYEMAEIIRRVERRNLELMQTDGRRGTLVMSRISSTSASLNAVPSECEVYLDRRMIPGESETMIRAEMDRLVAGKDAAWSVGVLERQSWTGMPVRYEPFHPAWEIGLDHPLTRACIAAHRDAFNALPDRFAFWDFSTNAVTPVGMDIPTIGFGPGDPRLAHMRDERCAIAQIADACCFYAHAIRTITGIRQ
jgi:putative selenium metabolism hydrolase